MSSAYGFTFYAEPNVVVENGVNQVVVGVGTVGGEERAYLNVGDGYRNDGSIDLTRVELARVVDALTEALSVMDESARGGDGS